MGAIITPLYMESTYPQLYIDRKLPKVRIDQSQCFAESGLKNPIDATADIVADAYVKAREGIGRIVDEGNRMAMIENDMPDAVPEIAFENSFEEKELTLDCMPKSRPKIEVDGHLKIEWEMGKVNFSKESVLEYKYRATNGGLVDVRL